MVLVRDAAAGCVPDGGPARRGGRGPRDRPREWLRGHAAVRVPVRVQRRKGLAAGDLAERRRRQAGGRAGMSLHPLATRFASVADAYERGRLEYAPAVVGALAAELG